MTTPQNRGNRVSTKAGSTYNNGAFAGRTFQPGEPLDQYIDRTAELESELSAAVEERKDRRAELIAAELIAKILRDAHPAASTLHLTADSQVDWLEDVDGNRIDAFDSDTSASMRDQLELLALHLQATTPGLKSATQSVIRYPDGNGPLHPALELDRADHFAAGRAEVDRYSRVHTAANEAVENATRVQTAKAEAAVDAAEEALAAAKRELETANADALESWITANLPGTTAVEFEWRAYDEFDDGIIFRSVTLADGTLINAATPDNQLSEDHATIAATLKAFAERFQNPQVFTPGPNWQTRSLTFEVNTWRQQLG
ncbi:hypothetical protein ACFVAJ_17300 [Agromyces sp. NPDC057679]|uniref:hypothetical protein n=1 Tax=Agromyces sp. NPDC057679 TaxID=3346207 RepID=UPI0036735292